MPPSGMMRDPARGLRGARDVAWLMVHAGYQLRFYEQGFGPDERLSAPTIVDNTPLREDQYVTNSFEYFGISPFFDQLSHNVMAEVRVPIAGGLRGLFEGEYWVRIVRDRGAAFHVRAACSTVSPVSDLLRADHAGRMPEVSAEQARVRSPTRAPLHQRLRPRGR